MFLVSLTDTDSSIEALKEARSTLVRSPLEPTPFASSGIFIYIEQVLASDGRSGVSSGRSVAKVRGEGDASHAMPRFRLALSGGKRGERRHRTGF